MEQSFVKINTNQSICFYLPSNYSLIKDLSRKYIYRIKAFDSILNTEVLIAKERFSSHDKFMARSTLATLFLQYTLNHNKVAKLLKIIIPSEYEFDNYIYIITKSSDVSLASIISSKQIISEDHIASIAYDALCYMYHLHQNNLNCVYLSPKHILLNGDCELKFSKPIFDIYDNNCRIYHLKRPNCAHGIPCCYLSPEFILEGDHCFKSDLWTLGCILFQVFTKEALFPSNKIEETINLIFNGLGDVEEEDLNHIQHEYSKHFIQNMNLKGGKTIFERLGNVSPVMLDFFKKIMVFNPDKRMSSSEALLHPFLFRFFCREDFFVKKKFDTEIIYRIMQMEWDEIFNSLLDLSNRIND